MLKKFLKGVTYADIISGKFSKIPFKMIHQVYNRKNATLIGTAVGEYYTELISAGMSEGNALKMTYKYMEMYTGAIKADKNRFVFNVK